MSFLLVQKTGYSYSCLGQDYNFTDFRNLILILALALLENLCGFVDFYGKVCGTTHLFFLGSLRLLFSTLLVDML